jgi:hypothetical protein
MWAVGRNKALLSCAIEPLETLEGFVASEVLATAVYDLDTQKELTIPIQTTIPPKKVGCFINETFFFEESACQLIDIYNKQQSNRKFYAQSSMFDGERILVQTIFGFGILDVDDPHLKVKMTIPVPESYILQCFRYPGLFF